MYTWSDVINYEGLYKVSTDGEIKSLNYLRTGKEKILKNGRSKRGYMQINLTKNKKSKTFYIHRLVMNSFLGDYKYEVNHKNGNKEDNRIDNLEYCTSEDNIIHREYFITFIIKIIGLIYK